MGLFGGSEASGEEVPDSAPEVAGGVFPRASGLQMREAWQSMDAVDMSLLPAPARGDEIRFAFSARCRAPRERNAGDYTIPSHLITQIGETETFY